MSIFGAAAKPAEQKDVQLEPTQPDSISTLSFSPVADYLAVGSWSNEVRIFEIGQGGAGVGKAAFSHDGPVLATTWTKDGTKLLSSSADNTGKVFDLTTGQATQFAAHDQPIKCVKWAEVGGNGVAVTAGWDKMLKYWDLRTSNPVAQVQLPERCYTLDVAGSLMVLGTADRHVQIYNLSNPTTPFKSTTSPLRMQTRAISCIPDGTGYAIGSIEGRVAIQHVEDSKSSQNFSFKCHRKEVKESAYKTTTEVFAVNCLSFHPLGSLATGGADGNGTVNIWDHYSRTRLKTFSNIGGPISDTAFSHTGQYLAYAVSYEWSKGHNGNLPSLPNKVMVHTCLEEEVRRRVKK
ncbi:Poly(A)+ RNA export protein [Meredithblackwellia eburnea MCA 4105]